MSKVKISESENYLWTWFAHYLIDPFIIMVALGSVGHMRDLSLLYSFSYWEVFLVTAALQHILPILVTSDAKKIPSKVKK